MRKQEEKANATDYGADCSSAGGGAKQVRYSRA